MEGDGRLCLWYTELRQLLKETGENFMIKRMKYRGLAGALLLALGLLSSGCQAGEIGEGTAGAGVQESAAARTEASAEAAQSSDLYDDMFDDEDYEIGYDENESAQIVCSGDSAQCDSDAVNVSGSTITITDEGTYILTGTLADGMVIVDAGDDDVIRLVLNGVSISHGDGAAIYVRQADKVFVTTALDTQNSLTNGGEYAAIDDSSIDGVIFSKSDLTLNGAGTLTIEAQAGHGVVSKDDLIITSGSYAIQSASHGLSGKDSIRIAGGSFVITSGKDGIQAESDEDTDLGYLYVADGNFVINADGDGLSASSYLMIEEGEYVLTTGGGASAGQSGTSTDDTSTKGIKAEGNVTVNSGSFVIDSADDSIHSNGDVAINGGDIQIASGDDGIHADGALTVVAGTIDITQSYEGLEGLTIDIAGGEIKLVSSDDGLNAAGGNDESGFGGFGGGRGGMADGFGADADAYVLISGGRLIIDASGDGIDSNGGLTVSGGEVYVSGPNSGGDSALDYASEAVITGGIVAAAGSSQMASNFGASSTQGSMLVTVEQQEAGSEIRLLDDAGEELVSFTVAKAFDSVVVSCPQLAEGGTYTLITGSLETEITMDSLIYSSGGTGGFDSFGGGMNPGRSGGSFGGDGTMPGRGGNFGPGDERQSEGAGEPPADDGAEERMDGISAYFYGRER